jgi:hypothetical protein
MEISISQEMTKQNIYIHFCVKSTTVDLYVPLTWKGAKEYESAFCFKK